MTVAFGIPSRRLGSSDYVPVLLLRCNCSMESTFVETFTDQA